MASEMMEALMALCKDKHIDELYLLDRLEKALAKSYAADLDLPWGAKVTIDRQTGKVYVYRLEPIDDSWNDETGEFEEFEEIDATPKEMTYNAFQQAKAEVYSIVREAARQKIYEEFSDRIGELITGTVLQTTRDFTIVKIREGVEAELPHFDTRRNEGELNERPAGERYSHGQHLKAIIIGVRDPNPENAPQSRRGERQRPSIIISRTVPELIAKLFENEVPEVYDRVVKVNAVAREPGVRSKVAVSSMDDRLDPVGACVGPKGSRVRAVVSELNGERVDVVLWDEDPAKRVANALSPAKVSRVLVDPENSYCTVIVPDDQLSLAIGKEGQNARLAAQLTGCHIDIKNETLARSIINGMASSVAEATESLLDDEALEAHRCEYVSGDGVRCRNMARPGSRFCGVHEKMDDVEVSDDPDSLI